MAKSYMQEVANMLGVQLGEEFKVTSGNFVSTDNIYYLDERGLIDKHFDSCSLIILLHLLTGKREIVKLNKGFAYGDIIYYYNSEAWDIEQDRWENIPFQIAMAGQGMVFKSEADAFNARPKLYKKFTGKEWE